MKILVLGASGFLGGKVYDILSTSKSDSLSLSLSVIGTCFKTLHKSQYEQVDIRDSASVQRLIEIHKPEVIIWCLLDDKNEKELNEKGVANIIKYIDKNTRLIYISTDAFALGTGNFDEATTMEYFGSENPLSGYINAKIDGEKLVMSHENHLIIRTGPIYGKDVDGGWDKRTSGLIASLEQQQRTYRSSNLYKTFVCVDDLSKLIQEAIGSDYVGIVHAGPEQTESYYSFCKKMAEFLGLNHQLIVEDITAKNIPKDTTMDTTKCRAVFKTYFRSVGEKCEQVR